MPFGASIQAGAAKAEGDLAWSRTKRMMQNRHQWEVSDLKAAGLNPILSAGAAPSMGSPPSNTMSGVGQAFNQGRLIKSQIALNKSNAAFAQNKADLIAPGATLGGAAGRVLEDLPRKLNEVGGAAKKAWDTRPATQPQNKAKPGAKAARAAFRNSIRRKDGEGWFAFQKRKSDIMVRYRKTGNTMIPGQKETY